MERTILLFGAGKSTTVLIDYLLKNAQAENWKLIVADADQNLAASKIGNSPHGEAVSIDINNEMLRKTLIKKSSLVISMLPPDLHINVAMDCITLKKHLLTASYTDAVIQDLKKEIENQKILFLYEMGLDPGIDHMSAMKLIDDIRNNGGHITSFKSHCGGLVAPESDDNPWHYKISWNPRNVVLAGKAGAHYKLNGTEVKERYEDLFNTDRLVTVPELGVLGWYPNRDSLSYAPLYGLENSQTFLRTTLRHSEFMYGWKNILALKLTDEEPRYETDGKTLSAVFKEHMDQNNFGDWLGKQLNNQLVVTRAMLDNLIKLAETEKDANEAGEEMPQTFLAADETGTLKEIEIDTVKNDAAAYLAAKMHEANLTLKQLFYLGMDDTDTLVNQGFCSASTLLQFAMEKKLALRPYDKDMIVMLHEIGFEKEGKHAEIKSSLIVKGENHLRTAMAKTVGLPLGIAAKLILNGKIKMTGLHIPTQKEIYEPVLAELETLGVKFAEQTL
ncbi:MAG TPA: saccharopine dehydrogenase C-terminal domain-containing protein [Chitinophagaceae bacterium]|nr:saccharopine dehydrogenase C-terminal domain-containing protein [Chitinophagaceae bacterium]